MSWPEVVQDGKRTIVMDWDAFRCQQAARLEATKGAAMDWSSKKEEKAVARGWTFSEEMEDPAKRTVRAARWNGSPVYHTNALLVLDDGKWRTDKDSHFAMLEASEQELRIRGLEDAVRHLQETLIAVATKKKRGSGLILPPGAAGDH